MGTVADTDADGTLQIGQSFTGKSCSTLVECTGIVKIYMMWLKEVCVSNLSYPNDEVIPYYRRKFLFFNYLSQKIVLKIE